MLSRPPWSFYSKTVEIVFREGNAYKTVYITVYINYGVLVVVVVVLVFISHCPKGLFSKLLQV